MFTFRWSFPTTIVSLPTAPIGRMPKGQTLGHHNYLKRYVMRNQKGRIYEVARSSKRRLIVDYRIVLNLRRGFNLSIFGPRLTSTIGTTTLFVLPSTMIFGPKTLETNSSPNLLKLINSHLKYPKTIMRRSKTAYKDRETIAGRLRSAQNWGRRRAGTVVKYSCYDSRKGLIVISKVVADWMEAESRTIITPWQ